MRSESALKLNEANWHTDFKRMVDFTLATGLLAATLPAFGLIALAIRIRHGRPVFFYQERCGKGLRRFQLIKFRTMTPVKHQIVNYVNDNRVTQIGLILRRTGLDSLPELINILKGDMSFVGPRPMPYAVEDEPKYKNIEQIPGHYLRSKVVPGLTGLAQIYCTKFCSRRIKFRYDNLYVKNRSVRLDIKLFMLSIWITLTGRNAFHKKHTGSCRLKSPRYPLLTDLSWNSDRSPTSAPTGNRAEYFLS